MNTTRRTMTRWMSAAVLSAALSLAQTPRTATALLDEAKSQAARDQRAIFAIFHASW